MTSDPSSSKTVRAKGWQRTVLSLVTLAWLACQIWAVLNLEFETWPVTELSFFSESFQEDVDVDLTGFTRDGRLVAMIPSEFGLERHQLDQWLMGRMGQFPDAQDPRDLQTLGELARIWNEGHDGEEEVVAVRLRLEAIPLPGGSKPSEEETVLVWSAA